MIKVDLVPRLGPTVADYPPGSTFGPRDARSYEFVWLLRGSATWLICVPNWLTVWADQSFRKSPCRQRPDVGQRRIRQRARTTVPRRG